MSITASATSAPATTWCARLAETPGSWASSSTDIENSDGIRSTSSACGRVRLTSGPSPDGAAPQMRASERNVLDVATAWSGRPARSTEPASRARSARIFSRSFLIASSSAPVSHSRVSLAAPSGSDCATSGPSSLPTAISREPPPMSKTASRPDDQPNHRRTARKVSRASSSPGSTSMSTPVCCRTCSSTSSLLVASRTADVAKPSISSQPLSPATTSAPATNSVSASMPRCSTAPLASRCSARRSGSLCENAGSGGAPPCASTTSRCPVFEPMSSTPSLMGRD